MRTAEFKCRTDMWDKWQRHWKPKKFIDAIEIQLLSFAGRRFVSRIMLSAPSLSFKKRFALWKNVGSRSSVKHRHHHRGIHWEPSFSYGTCWIRGFVQPSQEQVSRVQLCAAHRPAVTWFSPAVLEDPNASGQWIQFWTKSLVISWLRSIRSVSVFDRWSWSVYQTDSGSASSFGLINCFASLISSSPTQPSVTKTATLTATFNFWFSCVVDILKSRWTHVPCGPCKSPKDCNTCIRQEFVLARQISAFLRPFIFVFISITESYVPCSQSVQSWDRLMGFQGACMWCSLSASACGYCKNSVSCSAQFTYTIVRLISSGILPSSASQI